MADQALTRAAAAVVAGEAVLLIVAGIVLLIGFRDSYGTGTGVFALLLGTLVAWLGRSLQRGASWARTPTLFLQLLALAPGIGFLQAGNVAAGIAVLVIALGTGAAVLSS